MLSFYTEIDFDQVFPYIQLDATENHSKIHITFNLEYTYIKTNIFS